MCLVVVLFDELVKGVCRQDSGSVVSEPIRPPGLIFPVALVVVVVMLNPLPFGKMVNRIEFMITDS